MTAFTSPQARWAAVSTRNPLASSAFIYSVTTTKIYCRPTCPSRLARRSNVIFHNSAAEAEAHGFRACKRCLPNAHDEEKDGQVMAVRRACGLVRGEGERKWTVKKLGAEVGMTESHFCRVFRKVVGMTVGEYRASLLNCRQIHHSEIVLRDACQEGDRSGLCDQDLPIQIPDLNLWLNESAEWESSSSNFLVPTWTTGSYMMADVEVDQHSSAELTNEPMLGYGGIEWDEIFNF